MKNPMARALHAAKCRPACAPAWPKLESVPDVRFVASLADRADECSDGCFIAVLNLGDARAELDVHI